MSKHEALIRLRRIDIKKQLILPAYGRPAAPDRKASEHTSRVNSEKKPFTEVKGF